MAKQELGAELGQELKEIIMYSFILEKLSDESMSRQELMGAFNLKNVLGYLNRTLTKQLSQELISYTIPENLNHPAQKF